MVRCFGGARDTEDDDELVQVKYSRFVRFIRDIRILPDDLRKPIIQAERVKRKALRKALQEKDESGNGLICTSAFKKALERLQKGTEEEESGGSGIDHLSKHFDRDANGNVAWEDFSCFLRVLPLAKAGSTAENNDDVAPEDEDTGPYEFSSGAEVKAVELKLQKAAARASNMGVNIPRILAAMGTASTGTILRMDFVTLLSQIDLSLLSPPLHQRPMQGTGATSAESRSEVAERQLQRLQRLKDSKKLRNSVDVEAERQLDIYAACGQTARVNKKSEGLRDRALQEREEELNMIKWYRQGQKKSLVSSLLQQSITVEINMYPRFGHIVFFEYEVMNPFSHEERFSIQCADPDLRVVFDARQWQHYRSVLHPSWGIIPLVLLKLI